MSGKGKKVKGQTMQLKEFLNNNSDAPNSWADDDHVLPSGPLASSDQYHSASGDGRGGARGPSRPFPTCAPYTVYVGNLGFEIGHDDIGMFFVEMGNCKVKHPRIIMDRMSQQSKGFGYVEFMDLESLKSAVALNGTLIAGRPVRIDIAEPQQTTQNDRSYSNRQMNFRSDRGNDRNDRYDRYDRQEPESDRATAASSWRRTTPVPFAPSRSQGGFQSRPTQGFNDREPRTGAFDRSPREMRPRDSGPTDSSTEPAAEPVQRKKLELAPRTKPLNATDAADIPAPTKKSNPFGAARPIDATEAIKRAEEKLAAKMAELPLPSAEEKKGGKPPNNRPVQRKDRKSQSPHRREPVENPRETKEQQGKESEAAPADD